MKRILAGAASAVLAGALLVGAPVATRAATGCPSGSQCILGVPASVTWASAATQGGGEVRTLVGTVQWISSTTYTPTLAVSNMCRNDDCGTGNADIIGRSSAMKMAVSSVGCTGNPPSGTCMSACTPVSGLGGNALTGFAVSNPAAPGVGVVPLGPSATNICTAISGANPLIQWKNLHLAVTVPTGKNSGSYVGTITFGIS